MEHEVERASRLEEEREQVRCRRCPCRRTDELEQLAVVVVKGVIEGDGLGGRVRDDRLIELGVIAVVEYVEGDAANEIALRFRTGVASR